MHKGLYIVLLTICLQLYLTEPHSLPTTNKQDPGFTDQTQGVEQAHRRHKRQLGFWELYYGRYLLNENYFPSELDILSTPRVFKLLVNTLLRRGINYDTIDVKVQDHLDAYMREHYPSSSEDYFQDFRSYNEMMRFLRRAAHRCQGRCSLFTIGQSYEGRPLMGIKIGTSKHHTETKRRNIWIDAGTHAREWITHTTALYLVDMLIIGYTQDRSVRHLVDSYDWYILPCLNPDGYNYTWTTDRLWRKTRSPTSKTNCVGTDLNRNFGFKWGTGGASSNPCSNNYRGAHAYSEPESKALVDFIQSEDRKDTWLMFLTLHSKGQLVLSPWGYTAVEPATHEQLAFVGNTLAKAMSERHGMQYDFGVAAKILYRSSGTSRDWGYGEAGIPFVYTVELRDKGKNGWILAPSNIIPTGQEVWAGIQASVTAIEQLEKHNQSTTTEQQTDTTTTTSRPARYGPPVTW